jgi:PDZ domain
MVVIVAMLVSTLLNTQDSSTATLVKPVATTTISRYIGGASTVTLVPGLRPAVDVMINGRGPFRMLVETGSADTRLLPNAYARIRKLGTHPATDSVRFGESTMHGLHIEVIDTLPIPAVDGLLGLDAFADVTVTVNFPKRVLQLTPDTLPAANGMDILPMMRSVVFWSVSLSLPTGTVRAILDTQNDGSLSAAPDLARALTFTAPPVTVGRARGPLIGDVAIQRSRLAGSVYLGDAVIEQPIIDILPLPGALPQDEYLLGIQILNEFSISIDQRSERVRFERSDRRVRRAPRVSVLGASTITQYDGARRVTGVVQESAAADAGLEVGDVIVGVSERPMSQIDDSRWRSLVTGNRKLRLLVRRGLRTLTVEVTPRDANL